MKHCVIVGAGIIGLSTAYYLEKEGCKVTVIDKSDISKGASFVNAGYIEPSHFIPLAAPGMISKGLKWMFSPSSPFYIKPRLDLDFLKWAWYFYKSSTKKHVERSIVPIKDINLLSKELYQNIFDEKEMDFHFDKKGLMMYYQTEKVGSEERKIGEIGIKEGLDIEFLTKEGVKKYEPNVDLNIKGAVFYGCDAHMTPGAYMKTLHQYLVSKNVAVYTDETVTDFEINDGKIKKVITDKRILKADEVIMAAGSWSPLLTQKLGVKISMQAGKGYRLNVFEPTGIQVPGILSEAKVAVTPMDGFTRFAGTMEIAGFNQDIRKVRVQAIKNAAEDYYTGLKIGKEAVENAECGLRPVSPDGLPYIGRANKYKNLIIASGHAMMGWSLGPATGKLVEELVSGKKTSMDIDIFSPDRKF